MTEQQQARAPLVPPWLVALAAVVFVLVGLGSFAILDNNEGLYAEIPREMLASQDWRLWVIPHLNGLPYMEKPPLLYWLTALSFALFGESEWSARLVPALSSLACVAMLVWFGKAVQRPLAGRLAAIMFVTGLGVTAMSHVLMFDMLLTACLTAALMLAWRFLGEGDARFLRRAYAALALAVLAKGLVALVLFGLVACAYSVMSARAAGGLLKSLARWFDLRALLVFFAIAAPWHIVASLTEPVFSWFYFVNEHWLRFLGKREPHDYYAGAWWYYLPRMVIYLFPWSFALPCLLLRPRSRGDGGGAEDGQGGPALQRFLWLSWLLPLTFFSVSSAKANYYLVAVMPFAAFHFALALERRDFLPGLARLVPGLLIGLLAGAGGAVLALRSGPGDSPEMPFAWALTQTQFLMVGAAGMTLLALAGAVVAWRIARIGLLAYLPLPLWTLVLLMTTLPVLEPTISTRGTAAFLSSALSGHKVYLYRDFEQQSSLPFYLRQPLPVIDARSNDLFWGNKLRENRIVITPDAFMARLPQEKLAVVVMDRQIRDFRDGPWLAAFKGEKRIGATTIFYN